MKKIYLIIGALLLMFVLLGCDEAGNLVVPTDVTLPTGELTTNEDMTTVDGTTTEIPTTIEGATTEAPTTEVPATTEAPTTTEGATTTEAPTTEAPTTEAPTTEVPTTEVPTTEAPTTEAPTTDPSEPVVLLDNPTNLSIDGQVLSWTEVPNAVGYKVYVDGNFQAEVSTNQYDFSSIVEDYMVFNVRAIAFAEESNSNLSLDIVYNVNSASEILAMDTFMQTSGMDVSDSQAFATELVSRGMSVTEMQTMMTNMTPVMEKMQNKSSMSDIYPDLHTFLNGMTNIEALVSAFVRVELPNSIQSEIDDLTSIDGTCENYGEYYDQTGEIVTECYGYYDVSEDIEYLNRLLTFVETYPDEVVESVMVVINYMMRIENAITTQWVSDVDTLMQPASPGTFNINLAISVKNGLIMNFKNEMPSLNEFTLFNQTMMTFGTVMLDDNRMDSFIKAEKTAMQMQMSLGLVFNALLQIDAVYVNTLITALELEDEIAIITLQFDYINQFLEDNADELVALDNVYSAEEKEAIFFDLVISSILEMQGLTETEHDDIMLIIKDNIDFTNLLAMKTSTGDLLNDLLDRLDETDYELIIALHELATLPYNGPIIEDDDSGDEYNFKIDVTLDPGQYAVTVKGFSGYDVGEYDLLIYADYGSGPVLLETFTDTLSANDENQYTFTLIESAIVSIYTESLLDTFGILSEYSEVTLTEEEAVFNVLNSYIETMNPLVQDMTEVEYGVFINNVTSVIQTVIDIEDYYGTINIDEMDSMQLVLDIVSNTTPYQFVLLQTFMNQMVLTDYITELQLAVETEDMAQMIIIQLDFINNLMDASAVELAALDEIYTAEEKEAIFFDYIIAFFLDMNGLPEIERDDIIAIIETNIDFDKLLALQALSGDTLNDLLDRLIITEYELVYAFVDLMDVENTYYDNWNQYDLDRTEAIAYLLDSFIYTINPLVQDMTEVEYGILVDNALQIIRTSIYINDYNWSSYTVDELIAINLVLDTISDTTPEQLAILQAMMNQIEVSNMIMDIYNIYYNNPGTFTPEVQDYGMLIILANVYVDTYDIAQTDIDALIADALLLLDNPAIQLEMGITPIEVAEIKAMISAYPDNLYTQALIVVNYDYTNLTTEQIEELIELIYWLETPYQVQLPPV